MVQGNMGVPEGEAQRALAPYSPWGLAISDAAFGVATLEAMALVTRRGCPAGNNPSIPGGWWASRRKRRVVVEGESRAVPAELVQWLKELDSGWKKRGWARPPTRAPLEHLLQLPSDDVSAETFDAARSIIDCYYRAAFRGDEVSAEELEALRQLMPLTFTVNAKNRHSGT